MEGLLLFYPIFNMHLRYRLFCLGILLTTLLSLAPENGFAQKENYRWYFGDHAGLDFSTTPPTPITGCAMAQFEGSASIADPLTGKTLFYTDGVTVWSRINISMPNGSGLWGNASSTQSATIVPMPGDPKKYYIFTTDQGGYDGPSKGAAYSIVDMSLDGGRGDVTLKNIPLFTPATEKVTAVRHCNGRDYWILFHKWNSDSTLAYLLTPTGLSAKPIGSKIGSIHTGDPFNTIGCMVASPNGTRIAECIFGPESKLELFDFDNQSGTLSNFISLSAHDSCYGICFSPNNTNLFVTTWKSTGGSVYQYDLSSGNGPTILATEFQYRDDVSLGFIRPGPDGNLYVARFEENLLGEISNPNGPIGTPTYNPTAINLSPGTSTGGLPNILDALNAPSTASQLSISIQDSNFAPKNCKPVTQRVVIRFNGCGPATIDSLLIANGGQQFSILNLPTLPLALNSGDSLIVNIMYDQSLAGNGSGALHVHSIGPNQLTDIQLKGIAKTPVVVAKLALLADDLTNKETRNAGEIALFELKLLDDVPASLGLKTLDLELSFNDNILTNTTLTPKNGWSISKSTLGIGKTTIQLTSPAGVLIPAGTELLEAGYHVTIGDLDHTNVTLAQSRFNIDDPAYETCYLAALESDTIVALTVNNRCGDPTIRNSLNHLTLVDGVSINPNPSSSGDITVRFRLSEASPISIRITDSKGRTVQEHAYPMLLSGEQTISQHLAGLSDDIYLIEIVASGERVTRKLTLTH
jgi:hypothetical protein